MAHSTSDGENSYCGCPSSYWTTRPALAIDHACCQVAKDTNGGVTHDSMIISAKFLHFLLVGTPLYAPASTMRVGLAIEMWLFPCHFPTTAGKIECTSFVLG